MPCIAFQLVHLSHTTCMLRAREQCLLCKGSSTIELAATGKSLYRGIRMVFFAILACGWAEQALEATHSFPGLQDPVPFNNEPAFAYLSHSFLNGSTCNSIIFTTFSQR